MKNLSTLFFSFILLFGAINVFSQETESRMGNGGPYWILGVNGGAAWQDSDVKALPGGGWSFYLGHSLTNKPNAFFSTDLRFRYLNSNTFGQNSSDDYLGNDALKDPFVFAFD